MAFLIHELTFIAVDEDGNELKNSKGELRTFKPKGRWESLEYLIARHITEEGDEDDFEEITDA